MSSTLMDVGRMAPSGSSVVYCASSKAGTLEKSNALSAVSSARFVARRLGSSCCAFFSADGDFGGFGGGADAFCGVSLGLAPDQEGDGFWLAGGGGEGRGGDGGGGDGGGGRGGSGYRGGGGYLSLKERDAAASKAACSSFFSSSFFSNSRWRARCSSCTFSSSSIMLMIALTCSLTASSFSATLASDGPLYDSRSDGIWCSTKSLSRSCVSAISLVSELAGRRSTASRAGLSWSSRTPKMEPSSCAARKALAKRCCSGESEAIASANALCDGSCSRRSGIRSSSLFCRMNACFGSKVCVPPTVPSRTTNEENWRARACR
mmetsp:Transcript_43590/g.144285  ORF Transcript_43590/g.144285 Transcript_43590/m.144285 type:complete len:320 (-) Transcript_43590:1594-2553(-)